MLVAQQSCEDEDLSDSDPDQDQSQSKARNSIDSDDVIPFDNARMNLQPRCVDDQDIRQVSQGACLEAGDLFQQNPTGEVDEMRQNNVRLAWQG